MGVVSETKDDVKPIPSCSKYLTFEEVKKTVQETATVKANCSLCSISSEGKDKFEEIVRGQISKLQDRFHGPIKIDPSKCKVKIIKPDGKSDPLKDLIHHTAFAMEDIVSGISKAPLGEVERKLTNYQRATDGKLDRRKKRMRQATEYLTKHIVDLERMIGNLAPKGDEASEKALVKLLKIRGIIEDICLLCQRVGSAQKENSISSDIRFLVQSLDKVIAWHESGSPQIQPGRDSLIVPQYEKGNTFLQPIGGLEKVNYSDKPDNSKKLPSSERKPVVESEIVRSEANKDNAGIGDLLNFTFETLDVLNDLSQNKTEDHKTHANTLPRLVRDKSQKHEKRKNYENFLIPYPNPDGSTTPHKFIKAQPGVHYDLWRRPRERAPSFLGLQKRSHTPDNKTANPPKGAKLLTSLSFLLQLLLSLFSRQGFTQTRKSLCNVLLVLSLLLPWCISLLNLLGISVGYARSSEHFPWFLPSSAFIELKHHGMPPF